MEHYRATWVRWYGCEPSDRELSGVAVIPLLVVKKWRASLVAPESGVVLR
ncbi:MAG: hypothetical protein ACLQVI_10160 [Polyangiaceae bacterium]